MSQPILLQDEFLGMFRDKSRDRLPKGKVWDLIDYIPEEMDAPLRQRMGWNYHGSLLTSLDASAGQPARVAVATGHVANHVHRLTVTNQGTEFNYTLTFNGQTTANIEDDASAATIQTALEALSNIAPGDVRVELESSAGNISTFLITWTGTLAGVTRSGQLTVADGGLAQTGIGDVTTGGTIADPFVVAIDDRSNPEMFDVTNGIDIGTVYSQTAAAPLGPMVSYRSELLIPSPALSSSPIGPRKVASWVVSALGGSPPGSRFFATYKDRVVACSADTDTPHRVFFSAAGDAESWDTTSRWIDTSAPPIALAALRNSLLVFHEESIERIRGSIPPGSAAANMELEPLFDNVGLVDPFALHVSDEFAYWADEEGVYRSDGSSFTDLTKQGGMSSYWHAIANQADTVSLTVWRGYVWVCLMADDTELDTLLFHIDKRYWFRFSNIFARQFAIFATDDDDDLVFANREPTHKRVGSLKTTFADPQLESSEALITDGDGEIISPILMTPFYNLDSYGDKRWRHVYLSYFLYDSQALAPELQIWAAYDPALDPSTVIGTDIMETNSTGMVRRLRRPISKSSWGVSFAIHRLGDQMQDLKIFSLEADVLGKEPSRRWR